VYLNLPSQKKKEGYFVLNALLQSLFIIFGYCYSLSWNNSVDALRYSLVPFVLTALVGWFCFYELFYVSIIRWRKLLFVAVAVGLAFFSLSRFYEVRQDLMQNPRWQNPYYINLYQSFDWINRNLPKTILVASDEDQEGYLMHRPFISIPPGKSYNCANLKLFNQIYSPDYYLLSFNISDICFKEMPHESVFSNNIFRLLRVSKTSHL
jgi:hypothetical protein